MSAQTAPALPAESNLTRTQFLIWMGQKLNPDAPLYNMIQTFTFEGALAPERFHEAWRRTVAQSDALRTVVDEVEGLPHQRVLDALDAGLEWVDLSAAPDPQAALAAWLEARRGRMLDLRTRLFDTALIRLAPERFVWYLCQHHLITDGWSFLVVYRRVAEWYERLGGPAPEARPAPQFSAYAAAERAFQHTPAYAQAVQYWDGKTAHPPAPLAFFDRLAPQRSARTERVSVDLGPERSRALRALAASPAFRAFSLDLALYNLFATLMTAYLHRATGQTRLLIGTPFHNRPTPAAKDTVGVFIEIGALAAEVAPGDTFASLHRRLAVEVLAGLRQAQPGISSAERNRAYEVLLNYVNVAFPPFAGLVPTVEWVHAGYGDSHHRLRLQVHDFGATGRFTLHFDFNTADFDPAQRAWAIQHFLQLVDALLANPEGALGAVSLQSAAERQALVVDYNRTEAAFPEAATIVELFADQAARTPDAVALSDAGQALTYRALHQRSNQFAHHLRGLGVGPEQLVMVYLEHSVEVVIAILGILKAGAAYVPVDPAYPPERLALMLDDLTQGLGGVTPVVVTQPALAARVPAGAARLVSVEADFDAPASLWAAAPTADLPRHAEPRHLAYVIFTSGSTGQPKGVMIEHRSLVDYIWWARKVYVNGEPLVWPLFSSLAFDLTVTSIFTPLITGGQIRVYREDPGVRGMVIFKVINDNAVDVIKLTPAHLAMLKDLDLTHSRVRALIVGGEDFKTELARAITRAFGRPVAQFNEYGPTEATVGCMIHRFDPAQDRAPSVPIGRPADNAQVYVLDAYLTPTPTGVVGEMYLGGVGLARGYFNRPALTAERFVIGPQGQRLYKTGDLARWLPNGQMEFLGRADHQVKVGGARIELGEIEARLLAHPEVAECVVQLVPPRAAAQKAGRHCTRCGLESRFPGVTYDEAGVCNFCRAFDGYKDKAQAYFKDMPALMALIDQIKAARQGDHDCVVLYSGGKDSTYMLVRLVQLGLRPLAFTLDNGYISDEAKANIRRVAQALGVTHVFGATPAMNAIFVESLQRHANVCNGCFKTVYTLAVNLARERGLKYIFTGLSRGQFFETRLTEDLFRRRHFDPARIDDAILEARKAYHRREDAISRNLEVDAFLSDQVFDDLQFVDFYRYCDVPLDELYAFLDQHAPWVRPSDTGRSTNCLINDLGIYLHKKQRGFHNYALPYSWDVRMGHKTRAAALEELNDDIDEARVRRMMAEIGYTEPEAAEDRAAGRLAAYYVADRPLAAADLRAHLLARLPDYMLPAYFIRLDQLPLTPNGKVDRTALPRPGEDRPEVSAPFAEPRDETEARLAEIWREALNLDRIGIHDNFFELGGSSLPAIQVIARVSRLFQVEVPMPTFFQTPTIAGLAQAVEALVIAELDSLSDAEAEQLLAGR